MQNPPKYAYNYEINGENKGVSGHQEVRNGINTTGNYFVSTPDAHQDVSYFSDDWGFHPVVRYQTKGEKSHVTSHFALGKEAVDALHQNEDGKFPLPKDDSKSRPDNRKPFSFLPTNLPALEQNSAPFGELQKPATSEQTREDPRFVQQHLFEVQSKQPQVVQTYEPRVLIQPLVNVQQQPDIVYANPQQKGSQDVRRPTQNKLTEYISSSTPVTGQDVYDIDLLVGPTTRKPVYNENEKSNPLEGPKNNNEQDPNTVFKRPIFVGDVDSSTKVNREYLPPIDHNQGQFLKEVTKVVVDAVQQTLENDQFITDSITAPIKEAPSRQFLKQFKGRGQVRFGNEETPSSTAKYTKEETLVITQRPISNKFLAPVQAGLKLANDDCTDEETHKKHTTKTIIEVKKSVNIKNVLVNEPKSQTRHRKCEEDGACSKVFIQQVPVAVPVPYDRIVEKERKVPVPVDRIVEKQVNVPYPVPYPVQVTKEVKVPVDRIVEKQVNVPYPVPYPVQVTKEVKVPVERIVPYPVQVEKVIEKKVNVPVPYPVEKVITKEVKVSCKALFIE